MKKSAFYFISPYFISPNFFGVLFGIIILLIGTFFLVKANNQEDGGTISIPLKKAIIYPKKSHFFHQFSVNLKKGDTILYLQNVAKGIDTNTISLKGFEENKENISFTIGYAKNSKVFHKNHIIHALKDSIFLLKDSLENIQFAQNTLQKSQEFLKVNIPTSLEHFSKEKIQELYHFLQQKDIENQKQKKILAKTTKNLQEKLANIEEKIAFYELTSDNQPITFKLKIRSKANFFGELSLEYFTNHTYWTPNYKINISEKDSLVKMDFFGKITQKSGVNFQKTTTFLATKSLSEKDFLKEKKEKYLSLIPDSIFRKQQNTTKNIITEEENIQYPAWKHEILLTLSPKLDTNIAFFSQKTKKKYAIQLQPSFYREAQKVVKWENWVFNGALPAKAEIWLENQQIETTFLALNQPNLSFSLANDARIQSDYKPFLLKEIQKEGKDTKDTLNNNALQRYTQGFEAEITNVSKDTLNIEILEKLPIIQHEQLKLEFLSPKNPTNNQANNQIYLPEQGLFLWQLSLKPNEKQKIQANWILTFPKNYVLY